MKTVCPPESRKIKQGSVEYCSKAWLSFIRLSIMGVHLPRIEGDGRKSRLESGFRIKAKKLSKKNSTLSPLKPIRRKNLPYTGTDNCIVSGGYNKGRRLKSLWLKAKKQALQNFLLNCINKDTVVFIRFRRLEGDRAATFSLRLLRYQCKSLVSKGFPSKLPIYLYKSDVRMYDLYASISV